MKRVLIALILCLIFSSEIQAKKVQIITASGESYTATETTDECFYSISEIYWAYAHAHKSNELVLKALVGDEVTPVSTGGFFEESGSDTRVAKPTESAPWKAKDGESWSLVWVLQSTKGKGRVIDALDMTSGTCDLDP